MCSILTAPQTEPILPTPLCAPHESHCTLGPFSHSTWVPLHLHCPSSCSTGVPLFLWPFAMPYQRYASAHSLLQGVLPDPWSFAMLHMNAILPSTPHKSHCVLRPSWCPTKVPLSPWTVAAPQMIALCSHPLAAPHAYLTTLSDTCCALCGSPLPPNPLVCLKQIPLPPLVLFCATHASHRVPSHLLCPAAVSLYPPCLSVP